MSLFLKIFLWFWLALALMTTTVYIVTLTTQPDNFGNRWQMIIGKTTRIYAETAKQIYEDQGKSKIIPFTKNLQLNEGIKGLCFFNSTEKIACINDESVTNFPELVNRAIQSDEVETEQLPNDEVILAKNIKPANGNSFVLVAKWQRPRPPSFWANPQTQILRILAIILTAGLGCFALARYLVTPILKLRQATQKLSQGDLTTRVELKRSDELGELAKDFNQMTERIESLISAQKNLNRDISHELRSPLARMNVALELAKQKSTEATAPHIERIERESQRLNEMISNILLISKLESKSEVIEKHELNLTKVLESVVADANFEAQSKNRAVKIIDSAEIKTLGNERLLRSAIENVLRNAIRYTKENSTVEVSLNNGQKQAAIKIKDYGDGIPENELDEVFKPFYRIDQSRERKSGGIGLGLAIAKQAVHVHNGKILAKNTENGLVVEIIIPL